MRFELQKKNSIIDQMKSNLEQKEEASNELLEKINILKEKIGKLKNTTNRLIYQPRFRGMKASNIHDLPEPIDLVERSLNSFEKGDYKNISSDKKENSIKIENTYEIGRAHV